MRLQLRVTPGRHLFIGPAETQTRRVCFGAVVLSVVKVSFSFSDCSPMLGLFQEDWDDPRGDVCFLIEESRLYFPCQTNKTSGL